VQSQTQLPTERLKLVIDEGFLLHYVLWSIPSTYNDICKMYVAHVVNKYSCTATVVFDVYWNIPNTKDDEHEDDHLELTVQTPLLMKQWFVLLNHRTFFLMRITKCNELPSSRTSCTMWVLV